MQEDIVTWQPEIDELRKREDLGRRMGGADKIKRHRDLGKLTVRERVAGILDEGSFHEIGAITGKARYNPAGELIDQSSGDSRPFSGGRRQAGFLPPLPRITRRP
jgi:acetyl-CoA carboxylase carboxyltransferase component